MKKGTKTTLIIIGALLVTGVASYFLFRKPKDKGGDDDGDKDNGTSSGKIGKLAEVKGTYANTREGSCTNEDLVVKADGNKTPIGNVQKVERGCDNFDWFYVELDKALQDESGYNFGFYSTEHTHAWVREDVVNLV